MHHPFDKVENYFESYCLSVIDSKDGLVVEAIAF